MARTGVLNEQNLLINPHACTQQGASQNMQAARDASLNLQGQITRLGDQFFSTDSVGKVRTNVADALGYLENQMRDGHAEASAAYNASQDLLVSVDTVDNGGDKQLRFFGDSSGISGYSAGSVQLLMNNAGTLKWGTLADGHVVTNVTSATQTVVTNVATTTQTVVTAVSWSTITCVMTETTGTGVATVTQTTGTGVASVTVSRSTL